MNATGNATVVCTLLYPPCVISTTSAANPSRQKRRNQPNTTISQYQTSITDSPISAVLFSWENASLVTG
uniref:Uncharacterized protein n=1 Tax=Siphoviridae sp. ctgu013 TaxID=2826421 RepID=A0A8S5NIU7_9CAUD|nr:MAG TPA: hypothetical protein [Siphoviridae sp. ctgu013]